MNRNDRRFDALVGVKVPDVAVADPGSARALGYSDDHPDRHVNTGREGIRRGVPDSDRFEPLLDSTAAARLLGIHPKTLQKQARSGRVPAHCVCGLWRFRASELDAWLKTAVSSKSHSRSN
jgi:excisionase family DNA binding protein